MLELTIDNDHVTYEDICNFIEFHDFNSWNDKISPDMSYFGDEDEAHADISVYDDDFVKEEIIEFVTCLAVWLKPGVEIKVESDPVSIKATKDVKTGKVLLEYR